MQPCLHLTVGACSVEPWGLTNAPGIARGSAVFCRRASGDQAAAQQGEPAAGSEGGPSLGGCRIDICLDNITT